MPTSGRQVCGAVAKKESAGTCGYNLESAWKGTTQLHVSPEPPFPVESPSIGDAAPHPAANLPTTSPPSPQCWDFGRRYRHPSLLPPLLAADLWVQSGLWNYSQGRHVPVLPSLVEAPQTCLWLGPFYQKKFSVVSCSCYYLNPIKST